jgi:hypothetical protein
VAHDAGLFDAQMIEQLDQVAQDVKGRVLIAGFGACTIAETSQIGSDDREPGIGERFYLFPPAIPNLGKPVTEHDCLAPAGRHVVHIETVDLGAVV